MIVGLVVSWPFASGDSAFFFWLPIGFVQIFPGFLLTFLSAHCLFRIWKVRVPIGWNWASIAYLALIAVIACLSTVCADALSVVVKTWMLDDPALSQEAFWAAQMGRFWNNYSGLWLAGTVPNIGVFAVSSVVFIRP